MTRDRLGGIRRDEPFGTDAARNISLLLVLAVAALLVPSLTANLHTAAAGHERVLSIIVSVVLLALFVLSLPASIRRSSQEPDENEAHAAEWSLPLAVGMLAAAGVAAALVSDWFVDGLEPAINSLGISQAFAGLVIVAIAGNAVENVVGIQLAARNRASTRAICRAHCRSPWCWRPLSCWRRPSSARRSPSCSRRC